MEADPPSEEKPESEKEEKAVEVVDQLKLVGSQDEYLQLMASSG